MEAIEFEGVNVRIAEHQPEYQTLPAKIENGSAMFAFKLDEEELKEVAKTGVIYWKQFTQGQPMQPVGMSVLKSRLDNM